MNKEIILIRIFNQKPATLNAPLGIGSLISYVKERDPSYNFYVYDQGLDSDIFKQISEIHSSKPPLVIGLSVLLKHFEECREAIERIRQILPDVPIVLGGHLVESLQERIYDFFDVEYAIYGEGEEGFYRLLKYLNEGGDIYNIPSLIIKEGETAHKNPPYKLKKEEIPMPDYEAIRFERYFDKAGVIMLGNRPMLPINTSRGCNYRCIYCHNIFGKGVRDIEVRKILTTFEILRKKYPVKFVDFSDDIFNFNEERARELINGLLKIEPELRLSYPTGFRLDIMSSEFIDFIGTHNTLYVSGAIETASERLQRVLKKYLKVERAKEAMIHLCRYPILTIGTFLLGIPTETKDEAIETIRLAKSLPLHFASFLRVTPNIGTEMYENAPEHIKKMLFHNSKSSFHYHGEEINLSNIPTPTLNMLQRYAIASFYLRPARFYRIVRDTPRDGLFKGGKTFFNILLGRHKE